MAGGVPVAVGLEPPGLQRARIQVLPVTEAQGPGSLGILAQVLGGTEAVASFECT